MEVTNAEFEALLDKHYPFVDNVLNERNKRAAFERHLPNIDAKNLEYVDGVGYKVPGLQTAYEMWLKAYKFGHQVSSYSTALALHKQEKDQPVKEMTIKDLIEKALGVSNSEVDEDSELEDGLKVPERKVRTLSDVRVCTRVGNKERGPLLPLNADQTVAFNEILAWYNNPSSTKPRGFILEGFAGTGKTFLLEHLVSHLRGAVFCAPTNKATKEIRKRLPFEDCMTIYSLLGLKMDQVEDVLVLKKAERSKIDKYRIVILDECGMVNESLYEYILQAMRDYRVLFLFMGDPKQLNPIGELRSLVWKAWPTVTLTHVERHDNQILDFVTYLRKTKVSRLQLYSDHDSSGGVWYLSNHKFEEKIRLYARKGYFKEDARCIAWRNKTVEYLNRLIRTEIFGQTAVDSSAYLIDDRVVFTSPYDTPNKTNIHTDDEAVVKNVVVGTHPVHVDITCYFLTLQFDDLELIVPAVHESSLEYFNSKLNDFANEARKPGNGVVWKQFWGLKNCFASLRYGFALTSHRAQGSTYKYAFVDASDILSNSNVMEARRSLYVASSRPTTKLFLA